jgi:hypothetical protein
VTGDPEPRLSTEEVQDAMSLDTFFEKHCNLGDPCPSETQRMIGLRRQDLKAARERQKARKDKLAKAEQLLAVEIDKIVNEKKVDCRE